VTDDGWDEVILPVAADMEESGAFWGAEPLVAVAGVVRSSDFFYVDGQQKGGVGAVDEKLDAALAQFGSDAFDGEDEPGGAGDMVEDCDAGVVADFLEDGVDDFVGGAQWERQIHYDDCCSAALGDGAGGVVAGIVAVTCDEDFVAGLELARAQDGVDARGGVGEEDEILGFGADEGGECLAGGVEERLKAPDHELDGAGLEFVPEFLLVTEDGAGAGAEGAVVEEGNLRVEGPVVCKGHARFRGSHKGAKA
jgi:hypothetical protein